MKDLKITKGEFTLQNWVKAKGQGEVADELNETKRRLEECSNLSNKFNMEMRQQNEELSEKLNTSVENLHAQQKNIRELQQQNKDQADKIQSLQGSLTAHQEVLKDLQGQNEELLEALKKIRNSSNHVYMEEVATKAIKKAEQSV